MTKRTPRVSETTAAYADVRRLMDHALEAPGFQYILPTPGKAINFAQRCNKFRANLRRAIAEQNEINLTPGPAETVYDTLSISCPKGSRAVTFGVRKLEGTLIDADGNSFNLPGDTPTPLDIE